MRESGLAAEQFRKGGTPDRQGEDVVDRDHVGRPRRVLDEGQLAEEVAPGELERPAGLADDERASVEDDVEGVAVSLRDARPWLRQRIASAG